MSEHIVKRHNTVGVPHYKSLIQKLNPIYGEFTGRRLAAIERIRNRKPEDITANANRAIASIEDVYITQSTDHNRETLQRKVTHFAEYFDRTVFDAILHATQDLGKHIELKSPATLAQESGSDISQTGTNSKPLDVLIGNTDYIFGNSPSMPSYDLLSIAEKTGAQYRLSKFNEADVFVVPLDIVHFHDLARTDSDDSLAVTLEQYANNIYSMQDFKKIFASYNAALFETPQQAIEFYNNFSGAFRFGRNWRSLDSDSDLDWPRAPGPESARNMLRLMKTDEHDAALRMRDIMWRFGVYPPLAPEFQAPHKVSAERLASPLIL